MKKKKPEAIKRFMNRRNKETGHIVIPQTNPSPDFSGGSHKTKAIQMHVGVVKKATAKHLEQKAKRKKRKQLEEEGGV